MFGLRFRHFNPCIRPSAFTPGALSAVFQIGRRIHDQVLAANQAPIQLHTLRSGSRDHTCLRTAFPSTTTNTALSRTADAGTITIGFACFAVALVSRKQTRRWHSSPAADTRPGGDLHLHLHRRLLAIGFGRNLVDEAVVFAIGKRVGGDDALLLRAQLREIVLVDVELDFQIVQIGERDDVAFGALVADEAGGDELAFLDVALQDGARDRSADDGVVELGFGVCDAPSACRPGRAGRRSPPCAGPFEPVRRLSRAKSHSRRCRRTSPARRRAPAWTGLLLRPASWCDRA